jgi:hypothetical protein
MCFGGGNKSTPPPEPQAPPAPPTELDAQRAGTQDRQRAAARSEQSGYESTMLSGTGGVTNGGPVARPMLGT